MWCPVWSRDSSHVPLPAARPGVRPASPINVTVRGQTIAGATPAALTAPMGIGIIAVTVRSAIIGKIREAMPEEIPGVIHSETAAPQVLIPEASNIHVDAKWPGKSGPFFG